MGSSTQKLYLCSLSSDAKIYRSVRTSRFLFGFNKYLKNQECVVAFLEQNQKYGRQDTLSSRLRVFSDKSILEKVASGMSNPLVENIQTSRFGNLTWWNSGGIFGMFQEPDQINGGFVECNVCDMFFSKSRPFGILHESCQKSWKIIWETLKSNQTTCHNFPPPPPKKKKKSHGPSQICALGFQTRHQKHNI